MPKITLVHQAKKVKPASRADVFLRVDDDESYIVMITGWEGNVQAIDLADGTPWFAHDVDTPEEMETLLIQDHFKKLPPGSLLQVEVEA